MYHQKEGESRWFCQYHPQSLRYEIYFRRKCDGVLRFGEITEFVQVEEGDDVAPMIRLQQEEAQQLMDTLWDAGLRPVGAAGSAGQLSAVESHLADMRKIVFESFFPAFNEENHGKH